MDPLEISSALEFEGISDQAARQRYGAPNVFALAEELYRRVAAGDETRRVLESNSRPDYRQQLEKELKEIAESEMWKAGTVVRSLRPERAAKSKG